jgi:hypothetical protein
MDLNVNIEQIGSEDISVLSPENNDLIFINAHQESICLRKENLELFIDTLKLILKASKEV